MHVVTILIFYYFIYLCVIKSVILYLRFHVVYEIHYDNVFEIFDYILLHTLTNKYEVLLLLVYIETMS